MSARWPRSSPLPRPSTVGTCWSACCGGCRRCSGKCWCSATCSTPRWPRPLSPSGWPRELSSPVPAEGSSSFASCWPPKRGESAVSIHPDDEFSLRTGLEIELGDVVPGDGLADVIITRYRRGRRRRVAGAIGLVIVFASIGAPLGLRASTPTDPGRTILRLGTYTLTLPGQYQLVAARSAPCGPRYVGTVPGAAAAAGYQQA